MVAAAAAATITATASAAAVSVIMIFRPIHRHRTFSLPHFTSSLVRGVRLLSLLRKYFVINLL